MEILTAKFVVGEKHTTTAKMETKTNKGKNNGDDGSEDQQGQKN